MPCSVTYVSGIKCYLCLRMDIVNTNNHLSTLISGVEGDCDVHIYRDNQEDVEYDLLYRKDI